MNATDFPQHNFVIKAGHNPNTVGLPVSVCRSTVAPKRVTFVSKWQPSDTEMHNHRVRISHMLGVRMNMDPLMKAFFELRGQEWFDNLVLAIADMLPAVYVCSMNVQAPMQISIENVFGGGIPGIPDQEAPGWMHPDDETATKWKGRVNPSDN